MLVSWRVRFLATKYTKPIARYRSHVVGALGQVSSGKVHSTHGMWYQITLRAQPLAWKNDLPNCLKKLSTKWTFHWESGSKIQGPVRNCWDRWSVTTTLHRKLIKLSSVVPAANIESVTGWPRTRGLHASRRPRYRTRSSPLASMDGFRYGAEWFEYVFTIPQTNSLPLKTRKLIF